MAKANSRSKTPTARLTWISGFGVYYRCPPPRSYSSGSFNVTVRITGMKVPPMNVCLLRK